MDDLASTPFTFIRPLSATSLAIGRRLIIRDTFLDICLISILLFPFSLGYLFYDSIFLENSRRKAF